jgi:cardiolipin synthase
MVSDTASLVAAGYIAVELLGIAAAFNAVMTVRTAQGAAAWAIALVAFPLVTLPIYAVFGGRKFRGYVKARRKGDAAIHRLGADLAASCEVMRWDGGGRERPLAAVEALARMPFLAGNGARLLIDGEATFEAIFSAIGNARRYVALEFYVVRDDALGRSLKERLLERLRAGVKVYFVFDAVGSVELSAGYAEELRRAGARMVPFVSSRNPLRRFQANFRNHRKIVVVDGEVAFVGGHNVGDEYLGRDPRIGRWRDTHVELRGPAVLAVQLAFVEDWNWACAEVPALDWMPAAGSGEIPVLALPSGPADELETCGLFFLHAINSAQRRLWITSPYFVPDEAVLAALQLAALRGVDVRIVLPHRADHRLVHLAGLAYIPDTRRVGIRLLRYRPGFLHQKVMVADDVAAIGTANLDNRSFRLNFEITVLFADRVFSAEVAAMLERDFAACDEIRRRDLGRFRLPVRIAARCARLLAPVL